MTRSLPQKPHLLKIIPPLEKSIVVKGDDIIAGNPWHYHPEIEMLYCIKGKGTNFVGASIRTIEEGELLLLGSNLPHTRQRDTTYYESHPGEKPETIVIQFKETFLGEGFFNVQEFVHIRKLLERSLRGLKFTGLTTSTVAEKLKRINTENPTRVILDLLEILDLLATSTEYTYLNAAHYISTAHQKSSEKINRVYHYTIQNFREPIKLNDVASLTNHSIAAFCRYFKSRTRKSYVGYLTEIRIGYACELLMQGNLDIAHVCYSSGFNNLSHFHKQFRKLVKMTPSEYREKGRSRIRD